MTPPDATVALLKGGAQISAAFSVPPFQYQQLEDPAVHTVLNSFDVMGGSHTFTAVWAPAKFRDGNPVLYKALVAALKEATEIVNKDNVAAAALWIEDSKSKLPLDMVGKIVAGPQVRWTMTPENTMKYADFMAEVGTLKTKPESLERLFLSGNSRREGQLSPSSTPIQFILLFFCCWTVCGALYSLSRRRLRALFVARVNRTVRTVVDVAIDRHAFGGSGRSRLHPGG